jgi:hypothetical protein
MERYQNIIITGEKDYILAINYETTKSKPRCLEFKRNSLLLDRDDKNSTMINSLHVLNKYLKSILTAKEQHDDSKDIMCYIAIPDSLYKYIYKGTYKAWVKRQQTRDGNKINPIELKLWTEFSSLYYNLFMDVEFRKLSQYTINKPKYDSENVSFANKIIKRCNKLIQEYNNKKTEEILASFA